MSITMIFLLLYLGTLTDASGLYFFILILEAIVLIADWLIKIINRLE